ISLSNTSDGIAVTIKQSDKPNASFFPELPRKIALDNAPSAQPVEWNLTLTDTNTMEGTKETLVEDTASPTGATTGSLDVLWTRK
ncbi:MAG: hypothetical protein K6E51_11935, partial [Treponema sp.]|nr:hypothetical protein [Treponema sp.]